MADRVEIKNTSDGRPRVVAVEGQLVTVGSAVDAGIVVAGLQPAELRLCRTDRGYRAEPARPGATITVNGEALYAKDLAKGDVVDLGPVQLCWLPEAKAPAAAPPRAPTRSASPRQRSRAQSRSTPPRQPPPRRRQGMPLPALFGIVFSIVLGMALLLRSTDWPWPKTPQHYVDLARAQYGNGLFQEALGTLDFALGEATGPVREQALALQARIRNGLAAAADAPMLQAARRDLDLLHSFVARYLQSDPDQRPAARELLHLCRDWQQQYAALSARSKDAASMASEVEALQQRYRAVAHPDEPDAAADVLFAAQAHLRFMVREYQDAMRLLDGWLAAHPDDAEVRAARDDMLQSGREWFDKRLALVDQLISLGRTDEAQRELQALEQTALLPPWQPAFDQRRQRLGR